MKFFWCTNKFLLSIINAQTHKNNVAYSEYKISFFQNEKILEIDCTIRTYSSHSYTRHLKNVKMINFMCYFTTTKKCLDINEKNTHKNNLPCPFLMATILPWVFSWILKLIYHFWELFDSVFWSIITILLFCHTERSAKKSNDIVTRLLILVLFLLVNNCNEQKCLVVWNWLCSIFMHWSKLNHWTLNIALYLPKWKGGYHI